MPSVYKSIYFIYTGWYHRSMRKTYNESEGNFKIKKYRSVLYQRSAIILILKEIRLHLDSMGNFTSKWRRCGQVSSPGSAVTKQRRGDNIKRKSLLFRLYSRQRRLQCGQIGAAVQTIIWKGRSSYREAVAAEGLAQITIYYSNVRFIMIQIWYYNIFDIICTYILMN